MNPQTKDLIFASFLGGAGLLACLFGGVWAVVGAANLFKKEKTE